MHTCFNEFLTRKTLHRGHYEGSCKNRASNSSEKRARGGSSNEVHCAGLAKRLGVSPNRPVWRGAAVQAPKEGRSREATTRCINGLENVNQSIYGPSQPRHTLILEWIPATSAPTVQTAKRCHVCLFGRLEPTPS